LRVPAGRWAYQVGCRATAEILHDNPQLDSFDEAGLVLGDVGAVAGAEEGDFGLDVGQFFAAVLEVDLSV